MRQLRSLIFLLVSAGAAFPLMAQNARPTLPNAAAAYRPPVQTNAGDVTWNSGTYLYDPAGNITAIGPQRYTYDTNGRLVEAHIAGADGASDQSIAYDVYGNITSTARDGVSTTTSVDAATNRLSFASYDSSGNVTSYQPAGSPVTYQFGYDALNMVQVTKLNGSTSPSTAYVYTPADERIWSYNTSTNVSHWKIRGLDNTILRDYTDTGSATIVAKDYFYRDGTLLATMTPAVGTQSQLLEQFSVDHLGTPRLITDGEGHKIGFHTYYPFGQEWTNATNDVEALKFTGQERDVDPVAGGNDLDYMHARFYSPGIGRFLSVDRVISKQTLHRPKMWNRYAYVSNNPLKYVDPTGNEIRLTGCIQDAKSQACKDQTSIAQQSFGKAWQYVNNNNGVLTLKAGVSPAMLGARFGASTRALAFMANSKDGFNLITGAVAAAVAKDFGGARTIAGTNGGANIYVDTSRFPQTLGVASMGAAEAYVHETGHALAPYFASIGGVNSKYAGSGEALLRGEAFPVFLENSFRRQTLGLPNNDVRVFYKEAGDVVYPGTHVEDIWP